MLVFPDVGLPLCLGVSKLLLMNRGCGDRLLDEATQTAFDAADLG